MITAVYQAREAYLRSHRKLVYFSIESDVAHGLDQRNKAGCCHYDLGLSTDESTKRLGTSYTT